MSARGLAAVILTGIQLGARLVKDAFVGIDVAFAKRKLLPVVVCVKQGAQLLPLPLRSWPIKPPRGSGNVASLDQEVVREFSRATLEYLQEVEHEYGLRIRRIAIDAPRTYRRDDQHRRVCEQALDAMRISCFTTPSRDDFEAIDAKVCEHLAGGGPESHLPHANQLWMLVGFSIFEELAERYECLEVFPQAIVRVLGTDGQHKSSAKGLVAQAKSISERTGWPSGINDLKDICYGSRHDKLDAYLSAWIASLDSNHREAHGDPPNDVIWLPRFS